MYLIYPITLAAVLLVQGSTGAKLNFMTRNLALHNSTTSYAPRLDRLTAMIEELRTSDADGICLQEVWYSTDLELIMSELQSEYPYSYSRFHSPNATYIQRSPIKAPCSISRLAEFFMCLNANCSNATTNDEVMECLYEKCSFGVLRLSPKCRVCMFISSTVDNFGYCVVPDTFRMNLGGLLYLSKREINRGSFNPLGKPDGGMFTDNSDGRGYLSMGIKGIPGVVACTALTIDHRNLIYLEPNSTETSFGGRNYKQVSQLMDELVAENVILMGSFATGPAFKKRVVAELPRSYKVIKSTSPAYKRSTTKRCTQCFHNTCVDHILVRGHRMKTSKREFLNTSLTDHAAITAVVRTVKLRP